MKKIRNCTVGQKRVARHVRGMLVGMRWNAAIAGQIFDIALVAGKWQQHFDRLWGRYAGGVAFVRLECEAD